MTTFDYDLFVIGAGSGGVRAARMSASHGARVAIAEERHFGGTCVNIGCVPKKLMVYASHFGEDFKDAAGYGWTVGQTSFDWTTLIANKDREIGRLNGIYEKLLSNAGVEIFTSRAVMLDEHTLDVGGKRITAQNILVATGGKPARAEIPGGDLTLVSDDVFYLEKQPERILVVGGGYIGVEFAGIFSGLGTQTTLVHRGPAFLRGFDEDLRHFLVQEMDKKGVSLRFNQTVTSVERGPGGLTAQFSDGSTQEFDEILYAVGRHPNTEGLGLDRAGVALDDRGAVRVDDYLRSSVSSIYAIGDVTDRLQLTPVALAEGMAVARTLFRDTPSCVDYADVPTAVFSQPPIATVGLTEEEARARHEPVDIYRADFRPMRHTLSGNEERALMKLVVARDTQRVLGVHMAGMDAPEIIQGIAIAVKAGATKDVFDETIGIHPTTAEEFVTMREKAPEPQARAAAQ
ncbi:glutathione-disulfide reductase [Fodinicurvata halophila]|uniref:Glutathione reductase n=2 Tax=Fodinicurvata halophila TaxID=1419723 RepID=A0ABV8UJI5_9PROT